VYAEHLVGGAQVLLYGGLRKVQAPGYLSVAQSLGDKALITNTKKY
jgi:hypothetical protein